MMTKEDVMKVMAYCRDNNSTYKDAMEALGVKRGQFYKYKRLYLREEKTQAGAEEAPRGEFLQLAAGAPYEMATLEGLEKGAARMHRPSAAAAPEPGATSMRIELVGAKGTTMRICGELTVGMVRELAKMI